MPHHSESQEPNQDSFYSDKSPSFGINHNDSQRDGAKLDSINFNLSPQARELGSLVENAITTSEQDTKAKLDGKTPLVDNLVNKSIIESIIARASMGRELSREDLAAVTNLLANTGSSRAGDVVKANVYEACASMVLMGLLSVKNSYGSEVKPTLDTFTPIEKILQNFGERLNASKFENKIYLTAEGLATVEYSLKQQFLPVYEIMNRVMRFEEVLYIRKLAQQTDRKIQEAAQSGNWDDVRAYQEIFRFVSEKISQRQELGREILLNVQKLELEKLELEDAKKALERLLDIKFDA
jgi:hypothetical protein